MIRKTLSRHILGLGAAFAMLFGCGGSATRPAGTVPVSFDISVPADTPDEATVVVTGTLLPSGRLALSRRPDSRFDGEAPLPIGGTLSYRLELSGVGPGPLDELDSLWAPAVARSQPIGTVASRVEARVARWDFPPDPARPAVTLLVTVPPTTPSGAPVWVSGNRPELGNWNGAGERLLRRADGRYLTRLRFPVGTALEFKFTRGSWETVEKGAAGEEIGNRLHTATVADTIEALVATWRDQVEGGGGGAELTGTIRYHRAVASSFLPRARDLIVYLPPGYDGGSSRYPVLYMHDGQNLMDATTSFAGEWHVDETAERLIAAGEVEPLIIVGVYNTPDRISEYTPVADPSAGGGNGDNYGRFLVEELKPFIDDTYRTKIGAADTGVAGSSLGGLISMHFALTRWETFGRAGVVSPSVWWAGRDILNDVFATPKRPVRIWEDIGTAEGGGASQVVVDARALRDALIGSGWVLGDDLMYLEAAGAGHNEAAWAERFDDLLRFLYPAPAPPRGR